MTDRRGEALRKLLEEHRDADGALIQVLHEAQNLYGYLSDDLQLEIAEGLGLPHSTVRGVVTFYNFFRTQPRGEHVINVCIGTACHVKGAQRVLDVLRELLDVGVGETTEDERFTLQGVRCIGACGLAPAMMIDGEVYGRLDRKRIEEIVASLR